MIPEVSVIIPAYNTDKYIAQAIQSVLEQTQKNIEIIIIDDASQDKTLEIIKSFSDSRIKLFVNQKNYGVNFCTNLAIKEAKGNWIARLDSDDWFAPNRLEKLLQIANLENIDMIADDIYFIRNGKTLPWSTLLTQSKFKIKHNIKVNSVFFVENDLPGIWSLPLGLTKPLINRKFIIKNNIKSQEKFIIGEDFWFYLTCLAYEAKFLFVPKPYYFYRSRPGSLVTINKVKMLEEHCQGAQFYLQQDLIKKNPQLSAALHKRLILLEKTKAYFQVVDCLKQSDYLNAVVQMINNPSFFCHLFTQLPRIIYRRLYFYFHTIAIDKYD